MTVSRIYENMQNQPTRRPAQALDPHRGPSAHRAEGRPPFPKPVLSDDEYAALTAPFPDLAKQGRKDAFPWDAIGWLLVFLFALALAGL